MNPLSIDPLRALGGAVVLVVVGAAGGWVANGWRLNAELAKLRADQATEKADQAKATVETLQTDAKKIVDAAGELVGIQNNLGMKVDALRKDVRNAQKEKPLPPGCLPDAVRVRNLDAAVDAANKAATGQ